MSVIWNSLFGAEQSDGAERSELTGCPYKILGVCESATSEEIQRGYEAQLASCKQAYDLLIDGKKRDAYDRQKMEKKKLKRKSEQLESEQKSEKKKSRNDDENDEKLEKMRKELGELGGAGLFFGNDRWTHFGGARNEMKEKEIKKVLQLLSLGEKKINLKEREFRYFFEDFLKSEKLLKKFWKSDNWEVVEAGWTLQFKAADEFYGGDGNFCLWIANEKDGGAKFKATAQQIYQLTGEESNKQELESKKDGTREVVKYEKKSKVNFVRFNITFL